MGYSSSQFREYRQPTIECVVASVGYADFLDDTLPVNLACVDRLVCVTSFDDRQTAAVCKKHGVQCVKTDEFTARGASFNKGAGINLGLAHLRHDGWIIQLDADIALPVRFRNMLAKVVLREDCIYGALRVGVAGRQRWLDYLRLEDPQYSYCWKVHTPPDMPV